MNDLDLEMSEALGLLDEEREENALRTNQDNLADCDCRIIRMYF